MSENPNIEWKKKKTEPNQRNSRRIDENKLQKSQEKSAPRELKKISPPPLPNKIRKNIKDAFDDEEDDENNDFQFIPNLSNPQNNSLYNALDDDEKKKLRAREKTCENIKLQNDAVKLKALHDTEVLAQQSGNLRLSRKTKVQTMNGVSANPKDIIQRAAQSDIIKKIHLKRRRGSPVKLEEIRKFCVGVKRLQTAAQDKRIIESMTVSQVLEAGKVKTSDKKITRIVEKHKKKSSFTRALRKIFAKSGRKKLKSKKPSPSLRAQKNFNKIIAKKTLIDDLSK